MPSNFKRKLAVATTALAATAFAGGAYAATQDSAASARQGFLNDAAKRLNVTPAQLTAALRGALLDQVSAAVAAGKLTKSQAASIKLHIEHSGDAPLSGLGGIGPGELDGPGLGLGGPGLGLGGPGFPGPHFFGPHGGDPLQAAAKYLGLTAPKLLNALRSGKSPAQLARAQGKSTSGLEAVLAAASKTGLDRAQRAGFITRARAQQLLGEISARIDAQINRAGGHRYGLFGAHDEGGPGMLPPPGSSPGSHPGPGADPGAVPYPGAGPGPAAGPSPAAANPAAAAGPPLGY